MGPRVGLAAGGQRGVGFAHGVGADADRGGWGKRRPAGRRPSRRSVPWVYLSSFVVVNFHLAGLVDAAEGFFLAAVLLALLHGRWAWLPPLVAVGVLGKETVLPFAAAGMAAVWIGDWIRGEKHLGRRTLWCAVTLAAGLVSLAVCRGLVHVPPYEPHTISWSRLAAFPANLAACVFERTNVYCFVFLLPMGLMRIRQIPGRLLTASLAMALAATVLGAYADIHGNMQRPWFNTLGPVLVIASSIFLRDLTRKATAAATAGEESPIPNPSILQPSSLILPIMSDSLLPNRFLFSLSAACLYHDPLWTAEGACLDEKHRLVNFADLEDRVALCRRAYGVERGGLGAGDSRRGQAAGAWCRASKPEDSDGLQLFIDTRDVHNVHRAGRFCHRFIFMPGGSGPQLRPAHGPMVADRPGQGATSRDRGRPVADSQRETHRRLPARSLPCRRGPDRLRPGRTPATRLQLRRD